MKFNKRNDSRKINKIILFAIMFIGLGFAALSATLGINGLTRVGYISFDVHFENVEVLDGSMEAEKDATINETDNTQIDFSLVLTKPGEYYEFEVDVVNWGTLDAYLSNIEVIGLDEAMQKYLKVTYKYVDGGKFRINDLLKSLKKERIKVRVDFLYDITLDDLPSEGTSIDFTLNMTYSQDNGSGRDRTEVDAYILGQDMIAYMDNIKSKYVTSSTGINFGAGPSNKNGKGLYLRAGTEDDEYPIYYYRGDVDNNHVIFGGFCWKIVRTTELGGIKLIYDGLPDSNNQCNNTGTATQIDTVVFNNESNTLADIGYMFGTRYTFTAWNDVAYVYGSDVTYSGGKYTLTSESEADKIANIKTKHYTCKSQGTTCATVYYVYSFLGNSGKIYAIELTNGNKLEDIISNSFANEHDSVMKTTIDNLLGQEGKLEDAVWCNDRSLANGGYLSDYDITLNGNDGSTYMSGVTRNFTTFIPGLKDEEACPNKNDRFTKQDTTIGNGLLTYPVGLITMDEERLAGNKSGSDNSYLYTGESYWTLSPYFVASGGYNSFGFGMSSYGGIEVILMNISSGVRPSIVLKKDIVAISGDGSSEHPYVVE